MAPLNQLQHEIKKFSGVASRLSALPLVNKISPTAARVPDTEQLRGYLRAQSLAEAAAREIASLLQEGWTEKQTADLMNTYLRDHGVTGFFHYAFVWFGERTRFAGVKNYGDYAPGQRVLRPGEVFILDVAPIVDGYIADIGYTASLGVNPELERARATLAELRALIPGLFREGMSGGDIWRHVDGRIAGAGYDNIHQQYPFSVLGHRVHQVPQTLSLPARLLNFGWQSYWAFLSRGLFGQLLNDDFAGNLTGLWAVEPHIGAAGFGAKFEEMLLVDKTGARWLSDIAELQIEA